MAVRSVRGIAVDASGAVQPNVQVTATLSVDAAVTSANEVVSTIERVVTDNNGIYLFSLYANADLTPTGSSYIIAFGNASFSIVVTNAAYRSGLTYLDIAADNLVVSIPPVPGQYIVGPPGPSGSASITPLAFPFTNASSVTCNHNLNRLPISVVIVDGSNNEFVGGIANPTVNQTVVSFSAPQTGTVYIT